MCSLTFTETTHDRLATSLGTRKRDRKIHPMARSLPAAREAPQLDRSPPELREMAEMIGIDRENKKFRSSVRRKWPEVSAEQNGNSVSTGE